MDKILIASFLSIILLVLFLYFLMRKSEKRILICFDEMDVDAHLRVMEVIQQIPVLGAKYSHDKWNRTIYMMLIVERKNSALLYEKLKNISNLEVAYT